MLTKTDLTQIKLLLVSNNAPIYKEFEGIKESLEEIKDQIKYLPTKKEYFGSMDNLMKEVKDTREVQETTGSQLAEHSDKLEGHEERIGNLERKTALSSPPV